MERNKPYLESIRGKHPTIKYDATAYASGAQKTFDVKFSDYIKSVETIDLAIRTIANVISLCDMNLVKTDNKGESKPANVKNVDLVFPNEVDSSVDFLRKLAVNLFSQGAGLIITEEGKRGKLPGKMMNFYNIDVSRVAAESNGKALISEFIYTSEAGDEVRYKADQCIYINDSINVNNLLYSLSRLQSLNDVVLMQAGIVAQTKELLSGGAKSASIISADAPISDRNMKKIKVEFDTFMNSATASSMFMNVPLNVTKIGNSMTGAEMLSTMTHLNDMMIEHFAIPPYLLGRYKSGANRSTEITYANRIFFTMQIKPVLKNIEMQFTRFLREQLGLKNISMVFTYDDLDILKLPYEEQTKVILEQLKGGATSLNEAREAMELPRLEEDAANNIYMPAYLLGNAPVSYNNYDDDLERMLNLNQSGTGGEDLPGGNAGGSDNTNVETGSRGGPQDE